MIALFVVLAAAGRYAFLPPGAPDGSQCFLDLSEGMPFELPPICEVPVTLVQHAPEPTVPGHATHDVTAICPLSYATAGVDLGATSMGDATFNDYLHYFALVGTLSG